VRITDKSNNKMATSAIGQLQAQISAVKNKIAIEKDDLERSRRSIEYGKAMVASIRDVYNSQSPLMLSMSLGPDGERDLSKARR